MRERMLGEGRGQERNLMEFKTLRTGEGRDDEGKGGDTRVSLVSFKILRTREGIEDAEEEDRTLS